MAYRINLSCADRIRFEQAAAKLGVDGEHLVKVLIHDFFERVGVKNPREYSRRKEKIRHARRV